jgi:hypothetical protein
MMFFGDGEAWQETLLEGFNAEVRNKGSKRATLLISKDMSIFVVVARHEHECGCFCLLSKTKCEEGSNV